MATTQAALVTVERTQDGAKTEVVARVLRVAERGPLDDAALRLAGFPEDLPALGTCVAPIAATASPSTASSSRSLELVDLGQVAIELADGTKTSLAPRHFPDPAGVLSGVMYNARISDPERAHGGEPQVPRVVVRAAGNPQDPDAMSFAAVVAVPRDVTDLRLAGQDPRDWSAVAGPTDLTWSAGTESEATVVVDVRSTDGRVVNRCAFADTGKALLPLASDEGSLVVHRVQRERFRVDGHDVHKTRRDDGEIRFDTSRTVTFSRSARASR